MKKTVVSIFAFILFAAGIGLAVLLYQDSYPTALLYFHNDKAYLSKITGPLLQGMTMRGEIIAAEDNFGSLKLKTKTFNRMDTDTIVFRMREKGTQAWIVENTYATDRFPNGLLYPFGFPIIPDSKGKTYEFEVFSKFGTEDNAIGLEKGHHAVASNYVFSKKDIFKNVQTLVPFAKEKIVNLVSTFEFDLFVFMFMIPFFYYMTYVCCKNKASFKKTGIFFCLLMYFLYVYLPITMNSNTILFVFASVLLISFSPKFPSSLASIIGLVFLAQIPVFLIFGWEIQANRAATAVLFSMIFGIILIIRSEMIENQKRRLVQ